jgi:hypothetical protein
MRNNLTLRHYCKLDLIRVDRHQHNQYMPPDNKEEVLRENERNFVESYGSPEGPMKYLNAEQIKKIHQQIDIKLQELEDSGLTREEILYDQQVTLSLTSL